MGERARLSEIALLHDDVDLQLGDGLEAGFGLDDLGLLLGVTVQELPADVPRKAGDEEIEVGQGLVVGPETNEQGAHAVLGAGAVGRQRARLRVGDERLVELSDVLGDRSVERARGRFVGELLDEITGADQRVLKAAVAVRLGHALDLSGDGRIER